MKKERERKVKIGGGRDDVYRSNIIKTGFDLIF